jgi:hypothetical protein
MLRASIVVILCFLHTAILFGIFSRDAHAVPSFGRQANKSCNACHTVFPELTPFGRSFKLGGYVFTDEKKKSALPPISVMVQASYTEQKGLRNRVDPFADQPDAKTNLPQQASLFYGGKVIGNLGAFVQVTYDGVGNTLFLDNTDVRYTYTTKLAGKNLVLGLTLNNNPTVQDVWNTVPAWGFPSASSAVAQTPAASTLVDGGLAQQVGGIGMYAFWNNLVYGEVSVYRTNRTGITRTLGSGTVQDTVVDGAVPYWRLAVQQQWGNHSLSLGTFGLVADVYSGGIASGPTDRFIDTAFDAQYQFISKKHILSAQAVWIHEKQILDGTFSQAGSANQTNYLDTVKLNANYYYRGGYGTIGGTAGFFSTTGSRDEVLYTAGDISGSRTGFPDANGFIFQLVYLPWERCKLAVQYTLYTKFNGSRYNYDGSGRDASDNNVLYLLAWVAF